MRHSPSRLALLTSAALVFGCAEPPAPEIGVVAEPEPAAAIAYDRLLGPAQMEQYHPLTPEMRSSLTVAAISQLAQWQIDQLYARLDAGPVPEGFWRGRPFFAEGLGPRSFAEGLERLAGEISLRTEDLGELGETLWIGKRFDAADAAAPTRSAAGTRSAARTPLDRDSALLDRLESSLPPQLQVEHRGRKLALLFPAAVFLGESRHDARKPSIVIDHSAGRRIVGYLAAIDELAGSDGLDVRDEMRRIRPGLYLGVAYARGQPLLNFVLCRDEATETGEPRVADC